MLNQIKFKNYILKYDPNLYYLNDYDTDTIAFFPKDEEMGGYLSVCAVIQIVDDHIVLKNRYRIHFFKEGAKEYSIIINE